MKLHLPKMLLTAVLAACMANTTALGGSWSGDSYTFTGSDDATTIDGTVSDHTGTNGMFLRAGAEGVTATVTEVKQTASAALTISGTWDSTQYYFETLTIDSLVIGNGTDSATLNVGTSLQNEADTTDSNVTIKSISGTISTLNVGQAGKLTLGAGLNETKDNQVTFIVGNDNNQGIKTTGELVVASNATLQFAGYDAIAHGTSGQTITLDGGTWEANGTRQSLGSNFTINLINGTIQNTTGRDGGGNGSKYGVIDIAASGAKIVSSGTSSITGGIRLRDRDLTIEVAQDGTLSVDSFHRQGTTTGGIVKQGNGTLKITTMAANSASEAFYTGNTSIEAGTIEYALTSGTGEYKGTISGTGNIAKSGTGTVTLANISNLDGGISVTGGTLNITSLSTDKTMDVFVSGGTLNINSVVVDELNHQLTDITPEDAADSYFTNDGTASTTSGFKVEDTTYLLFEGYVWDGSVTGFTVGSQDGNTTLSKSGVGTMYYVNGGETHTISEASDYINGRASRYIVEKDSTLVIDADQKAVVDGSETVVLSAAQLLTDTIGDGNIKLSTNVAYTDNITTEVTGKLTINNGATLSLGDHKSDSVDISSFSSIDLDNGTIKVTSRYSTFQNITVTENGGVFAVNDRPDDTSNAFILSGTTTIEESGTFTIATTQWRQITNIETLTGNGNLLVKDGYKSSNSADYTLVNIKALSDFDGGITVEKTYAADTDPAKTEVSITTNGTKTLSALTLKNGGALTMLNVKANSSDADGHQTTNIKTLAVDGAGTLGTTRSSSCFHGTINVESLSNTGDSAVLTLMNGSQCNATTTINLNGGSLKGTINVQSNAVATSDQARKLQVNINSKELAKDAVINFQEATTGNTTGDTDVLENNKQGNYNRLGVGADTVQVAGLTGETTRAATITSTDSSKTRTLEIIAAEGADYSTNAAVEASVNLAKSGAGTQTFTSSSIASKSISVNGGVLALTGLNELQLQDLVVASGATLSVGSAVATVDTDSGSQSTPSTSVSGSATLEGGAVVSSSLDLSSATSLTLNGIESNGAVNIAGDLTLPGSGTTLTLSGDILNSMANLGVEDKLGIFSVTGGFFVGTTELTDGSTVELSSVFTSSDVNISFEEYYLGFNQEGGNLVYVGKMIPEPTTATLSLLALAALAARRRRR